MKTFDPFTMFFIGRREDIAAFNIPTSALSGGSFWSCRVDLEDHSLFHPLFSQCCVDAIELQSRVVKEEQS